MDSAKGMDMARVFDPIGKMFLLLGMLSLGANAAVATVIPFQTLSQMIEFSPVVVRGKVLSKTYLWGPGQRHIYTDLQLQVLERLKGETSDTVVIRELGGVMGDRVSIIPGSATYRLEEEVVLFLEAKRPGQFYFVMGLAAGKFEVLRQGTQALLHRNVQDISFHRPLGSSTKLPTIYHLNYSESPLSLSQLRVMIAQSQASHQSPQSSGSIALAQPGNTPVHRSTLTTPSVSALPEQHQRANMLIFLQRWKASQRKQTRSSKAPGVPIVTDVRTETSTARPPGFIIVRPVVVPAGTSSAQGATKR